MRHHKANRTLCRPRKQRTALLNTLAREVILHDSIRTTEAKAKEVRPYVERLVTEARKGTIASIRRIEARIGDDARSRLVDQILPRLADREGGYTRITKLPYRESDGASMAVIEFVA